MWAKSEQKMKPKQASGGKQLEGSTVHSGRMNGRCSQAGAVPGMETYLPGTTGQGTWAKDTGFFGFFMPPVKRGSACVWRLIKRWWRGAGWVLLVMAILSFVLMGWETVFNWSLQSPSPIAVHFPFAQMVKLSAEVVKTDGPIHSDVTGNSWHLSRTKDGGDVSHIQALQNVRMHLAPCLLALMPHGSVHHKS